MANQRLTKKEIKQLHRTYIKLRDMSAFGKARSLEEIKGNRCGVYDSHGATKSGDEVDGILHAAYHTFIYLQDDVFYLKEMLITLGMTVEQIEDSRFI